MSSYFADFIAHIDERKRPENFPHVVHVKEVYDSVESLAHLQFLVNDKFIKLVSSGGLVVVKEDEILDEGKISFDKRVFVPWHMITHMELDVHHIPEKPRQHDSIVPPSSLPPEKPEKETIH